MARFVSRGRGQDRLSTTTCAAPTLHSLRQLPAARVRERAGARRWARSEGAGQVRSSAVRMDLPSVRTTRPWPPRSVSGTISLAYDNPPPGCCRLGRATDVTLIKALWRDPSGGFVLLGSEMDTGGHRSCTKFKNWNRLPERHDRGLLAREALGPLGTQRLVICLRNPAGACAPSVSARAVRNRSARAKGSKGSSPKVRAPI
jgi:hypothetical protein